MFSEPRPGFEWVTGTKLTKNEGRHIFVTIFNLFDGTLKGFEFFFSSSMKVTFFLEYCTNVTISSHRPSHHFLGFGLEQNWV